MKFNGFTLIELLVVVAIIGILAAVGVNTFSGFQEKAKISAAKANQKSVAKWLNAEAQKCQLDFDEILKGETTCSYIRSTINSVGNPAGKVVLAIEK